MSNISQSIGWWCFVPEKLDPETFVRVVAEAGFPAIDLVPPDYWSFVIDRGLAISSVAAHQPLTLGLNRFDQHSRLEAEIYEKITQAKQFKIPALICFSGNREGLSDSEGIDATAAGLAKIAPFAEEAGVTLLLELLNSKIDHPDYQANRTLWGARVCQMVSSPRVKLLFDIYHMQIMEGDIIRNIRTHSEIIGEFHTAGNPGRNELDENQEIYYPAILRAIKETGYSGFLAHEFIPRGEPVAAIHNVFKQCSLWL